MKHIRIGSASLTSQSLVLLTCVSGVSDTKNPSIWEWLGLRHTCIMWERFSVHRHTYVYVRAKSTPLLWTWFVTFRRLVSLASIIGRNITIGSWLISTRFSSSRTETMQAMISVSPFLENCPTLSSYKRQKAKMLIRSLGLTEQTISKKR